MGTAAASNRCALSFDPLALCVVGSEDCGLEWQEKHAGLCKSVTACKKGVLFLAILHATFPSIISAMTEKARPRDLILLLSQVISKPIVWGHEDYRAALLCKHGYCVHFWGNMNAKEYAGSGIIGYQTGRRFFRHACFNKTATQKSAAWEVCALSLVVCFLLIPAASCFLSIPLSRSCDAVK